MAFNTPKSGWEGPKKIIIPENPKVLITLVNTYFEVHIREVRKLLKSEEGKKFSEEDKKEILKQIALRESVLYLKGEDYRNKIRGII